MILIFYFFHDSENSFATDNMNKIEKKMNITLFFILYIKYLEFLSEDSYFSVICSFLNTLAKLYFISICLKHFFIMKMISIKFFSKFKLIKILTKFFSESKFFF